jgi:signal transduction histidine kinase
MNALGPIVRDRVALLDSGVSLRRGGGFEPAAQLIRDGRGKTLMDSARAILNAIEMDEQRSLEARLALEESRGAVVIRVVIVGTAIAAILALFVNMMIAGYASRQEADAAALERQNLRLREQHQALEEQATEMEAQAGELAEQAAALEMANDELLTANEELVSQRARAEEARTAAATANKAKSEFLSAMSHELRTPLNAIAGHVQLIEMGLHGPIAPAQKEALARVERAQKHLLGLVNGILSFARVDSGRVEYDIQPIALRDLIGDVTPMIEPQVMARGLVQKCLVPDLSLLVWADRERAVQVLLNLLANAVKFTSGGGRVTIDCADDPEDGERIHLQVRDTGRGIPPEQLERVFEPFVQLNRNSGGAVEGTGLGLAISRELARGMGGDLWADSDGSSGSTFTFVLRRVTAQSGHPTDRRTRNDGRRRSGAERRNDATRLSPS